VACDFFTVETAWLKRIYVLFFISLESRRVEFVACTANPTGAWLAHQARNPLMTLDDRQQPLRFLIHDRDAKFSGGCDHVYNQHRPHRALALRPPEQADGNPTPLRAPAYPQLNRRDLLGGLVHEYEHAA
jgi:hypothetical protein